jgi:hypothetical protein
MVEAAAVGALERRLLLLIAATMYAAVGAS